MSSNICKILFNCKINVDQSLSKSNNKLLNKLESCVYVGQTYKNRKTEHVKNQHKKAGSYSLKNSFSKYLRHTNRIYF